MINPIPAETKDKILDAILSESDKKGGLCFQSDPTPLLRLVPSKQHLQAVLDQFTELGLFSKGSIMPISYTVQIKAAAFDFMSHGGFVAEEALFNDSVEKLRLECESLAKELQPDFPEKAERLVGFAASVSTVLSLFHL